MNFQLTIKIHNDLLVICLAYYCNCNSLRAVAVTKIIGAPANVVCPPGASDRKPTRRPGRKAPTLRPDSNTSGTAYG